ncbi:MAG: radical SAM protein [Clostridia bacterium]|nr:radical SAM protein [Clostridia bacterium]
MNELIKEFIAQNRLKRFSGNGNEYIYDAFSQNVYPVNKIISEYFFSDKENLESESDKQAVVALCNKLSEYKDRHISGGLPETHLTINFSNKCNLNCSYCYRHKDNRNVMSLEKAFEVIEYADKYFKNNNDEIIFSLDMTAESFLDADEIIKFDDKLAEYENLYIEESEIMQLSYNDFLDKLKNDLYKNESLISSDDIKEFYKHIILDEKLYSRFGDKEKVNAILAKGNYDPEFLDKKRQLRLNRELLESFYPDYLKHKDYQQFRIWFMSNGTHITSKEIELIKRIRIDPFWISLDGPEEVHNKNRKYYSNKGSHSVVVQNIKTLQENGINVKVSCVMTGDYPYPEKLYTYLKSLKVSAIQICPVRNGCSSSFTTDSLEMVKQGYKNLFELIYEEIQKNDYSAFTLLKEDLSMGAISTLLCRVRQSERCTWGHEVVLDEKGNMYPCLYVIGEEEFSL